MNNNIRAVQLDLDILADDEGVYDRGDLEDHIVDRVVRTRANTVYIQSFIESEVPAEEEYKKNAYALFFNTPRSVKAKVADGRLMADAIRIIKRRVPGCKVLAWAPTLNCAWLTEGHPDNELQAAPDAERVWYHRGTPFSQLTHDVLVDMYFALGQSTADLDGVLFQDDMIMSNWEDVSPAGKAILKKLYNLNVDNEDALFDFLDDDDNPKNIEWQRYKTRCLNELSKTLFNAYRDGYKQAFPDQFKQRQSQIGTRLLCARDLYAATIFAADSKSGEWYAQDLDVSLDLYDQVVVMTYYNEEFGYRRGDERIATNKSRRWLNGLAAKAVEVANRDGLIRSDKLIMKLQTVIWGQGDDIPIQHNALKIQARELTRAGIQNLAFYPAMEEASSFNLSTL